MFQLSGFYYTEEAVEALNPKILMTGTQNSFRIASALGLSGFTALLDFEENQGETSIDQYRLYCIKISFLEQVQKQVFKHM